jgi:hypothetical protein
MMNSKNLAIALLGATVAALLVALAVLFWKVDRQSASIEALTRRQNASAPPASVSPPVSPAVVLAPPAAVPAPLAFPPGGDLKTPNFVSPPSLNYGAPTRARDAATKARAVEKAAKLSELQKDLRALMARSGGRPAEMDMDELDAILVRLIDIQGNTALSGIDVQALRQNLAVAKEMQALAGELKAETRRPEPDRGKIQRITEKIQSLQKNLRVNIMAAPVVPPLPGGGEKK